MTTQPWAVAVGCFVAGSLAAAGIANATSAPTKIPDSNTGVITACMKKKTGKVRFINAQKGKKCTKKEKKVTFNQAGPQGEQGPVGPVGQPGPTGPSNAYVALRDSPISLQESASSNNVVTLELPAGSYVLSGDTSVKATNTATTAIQCHWSGSPGSTITRTAQSWTVSEPNHYQPFTVNGAYTNATDGAVSLACWPYDEAVTSLGAAQALNGIVTATRVGEVTGP